MNSSYYEKLEKKYPFLTVLKYAGNEYVGIVSNSDTTHTTFYDYGAIHDEQLKLMFLELSMQWWWESNRMIPINIFLKQDWNIFRPYIKTVANKDLEILHGPVCKLSDLNQKRTKKKSITLVRKLF
jgi:hypothetical protein